MASSPEELGDSKTAQPFSLLQRLRDFASGALKGATTDAVGAPVDIINTIITPLGLGSNEPIGGSKHLRRVLAGAGEVEDKSLYETAGTFVNPENAAKAMIIGAARIPSRYKNYVQELGKVKSSVKDSGVEVHDKIIDRADLMKETGVYFDRDKKHKTVISDAGASLNEGAITSRGSIEVRGKSSEPTVLADVLLHDELYKLYPELKTIPLKGGAKFNSGSMQPDNEFMTLGPNSTKEGFMEVILHETQHAVQHIEGFGRGGNTAQFLSFDPVSIQVKLNKARESGDVAQKQAADRFAKKLNSQLEEARNRYLNLPGEQEARYTQEAKGVDGKYLSENDLRDDITALLRRGDTPQTHDTRPLRNVWEQLPNGDVVLKRK